MFQCYYTQLSQGTEAVCMQGLRGMEQMYAALPKQFQIAPDLFRTSTNQANLLKLFLGLFL